MMTSFDVRALFRVCCISLIVQALATLPSSSLARAETISGIITVDPLAKSRLPPAPLLTITASNSEDPKKPPIIVKRIPAAKFPYKYALSDEDITLVGSTFVGNFYINARVETQGTEKGILKGEATRNPVSVGSTGVDIVIGFRSTNAKASASPSPPANEPGPNHRLKIGLLWSGSTPFDPWSVPEGLRQAFGELGYIEGQNILFEPRYAEANYGRLSELATQLVRQKVDVILAAGDSAAVQAAKAATTTIPVVMIALADAVQLKLVSSLAHPGSNVTGLSVPLVALAAKQLQLLKQSDPQVFRVAVLWNPTNPAHSVVLEGIQPLAHSLNLKLEPVKIHDPSEFGDAFAAIQRAHADAVLVLWDPMLYAHGGQIADLALQSHLPTISTYREFAEAAGLLAYGPRPTEMFSGGASYVDKIIRGTKPADLPVEQPVRFDLTVNAITAKALNLTMPKSIFIRADKVIR
jgi:ABC-type uncharacterized transport system substrate-binding protein